MNGETHMPSPSSLPGAHTKAMEVNLSPRGRKLYIFFGGIAAGISMPPFEFYQAAKILDEHKIFIRDFTQSWYQNGLPGMGWHVYATARRLRKNIEAIDPEDVYFVGNSMGGYAAILFCALTGRGRAIAFAPQSFISPRLRKKHGDERWKEQIHATYRTSWFKPRIWDLRPLLLRRNDARKIEIFVSRADPLDHLHASHIQDIRGVQIHEFDEGGHGIVRMLRDQGRLPAIMTGTYEHA